MKERVEKLYDLFEGADAPDVILVTLPKLVYYFSGFYSEPHERFLALVCVKGESPFLVVPKLDYEKAASVSTVTQIYAHEDTDNPYEILKRHLPEKVARIGIQKDHLSVNRYEALMQTTGAMQAVDVEPELNRMRVIKSETEIAVIKRAIVCIEEVFRAVIPYVKPGVTEIDLVAEMEYRMKKLGADAPSFDTMVLSGAKTGLPHGVPGTKEIQEGELLLFDAGVFVDGYASDLTRTFAVGVVNTRCREIYDTVLQANMKMIEAVRPSVTFGSLDHAARQVIESKGDGEYFITRAGHGFGLEIHEYPSIHGLNPDLLQAGMVFTAEPGIYIPGLGGVRIEDNVLVTPTGAEVLTSFPKEWTVIGV
ncbi:aminopeptidase P family protein [Cohnella pontilimi]|uniref:Aminopeptidase P family protein n=1 Tax=Cohnella pontilimi TaxID=2564100 RepID=A0A4U0F9B8_9BACL|nr:Xaa-Pro peptidase family protein [Cohnella pontilimi]TJY41180.1 aminopeptidase P family protein [Cohnella pontilimi]